MAINIQEQEALQKEQDENIAPSPLAPYTRHLMVVVVILGLGLVILTGVVISTIIDRLGTGIAMSVSEPESASNAVQPTALPEALKLSMPANMALIRVSPAGRDLVLEIGNGKTELIWVVDTKTGEIKSAISLD